MTASVGPAGRLDAGGAPAEGLDERLSIVIGGHVDHGKSTVVGRLLADTNSLPEGKLAQVRALCERTAKPFEYAFLLDALKDEQAQGITIDAARVFFRSAKRHYVILDAPGHVEFLKNMVTGAARAEAALLVIDAGEGVRENSRRHGYLMSMLGIRQFAVLVNKMDLVAYDEGVFRDVEAEYTRFLDKLDIRPAAFVPVCGRDGDNVAERSASMPWYDGPTVLEALDRFVAEPSPTDVPLRMPVQDVYKFTQQGDARRIVAGTVESGRLRVGDEVVFYPSGKRSRVRSLEAFNREMRSEVAAGEAAGFTLEEQVYVVRGELAARADEPRPSVTSRLRVSLFWLGKSPLVPKKAYALKLGSARVTARLEEVLRVVDASSLSSTDRQEFVGCRDVAECVLKLQRPIAVDLAHELAATSRFVLVDDYEIRGGGIVREALPDKHASQRDKVLLRDAKWEPSSIPAVRRADRYSQRPTLLLVTGAHNADRKSVAKELEAGLFEDGRLVYFLGIGNVLYGVDADIERKAENRSEHLRRLAEVANVMLDAGMLLIVTAAELTQDDLEIMKTSVNPAQIETVWVGERVTTDIAHDLWLGEAESGAERVERMKALLRDRGIIFRPW